MKKYFISFFIIIFLQSAFCSTSITTNAGNLIYFDDFSINTYNSGIEYKTKQIIFSENFNILNINGINCNINEDINYHLDKANLFTFNTQLIYFTNLTILDSIGFNFAIANSNSRDGQLKCFNFLKFEIIPSLKIFNTGLSFFLPYNFQFYFDYYNLSVSFQNDNDSVSGKGHVFTSILGKNFYLNNNFDICLCNGYIFGFGEMDAFLTKNKMLKANISFDANIDFFSFYLLGCISKQIGIFNFHFGTGFFLLPYTKCSTNYKYSIKFLLKKIEDSDFSPNFFLDKYCLIPLTFDFTAEIPVKNNCLSFSMKKNIFIPFSAEVVSSKESLSETLNSAGNQIDVKSILLSGLSIELKINFLPIH